MTVSSTCIATAAILLALVAPVPAQTSAPQEKVAAIKKSLQESQARLRQFEWIETTIVTLEGEEKSRKQSRCYYGADGVLQKVPVAAPESGGGPRGIRGKIARNKKEDLTEYMQAAAEMAHAYVPPDGARLQKSKDGGKASLHATDPGKSVTLEFRDYLKAGDSLSVRLDVANDRFQGLRVATYLETSEDPVGLDIRYSAFPDGTGYPVEIQLDAPKKKVKVTIQNSGYRQVGR